MLWKARTGESFRRSSSAVATSREGARWGAGWVHENKRDGFRIVVRKNWRAGEGAKLHREAVAPGR
jgi:hypothetical protein